MRAIDSGVSPGKSAGLTASVGGRPSWASVRLAFFVPSYAFTIRSSPPPRFEYVGQHRVRPGGIAGACAAFLCESPAFGGVRCAEGDFHPDGAESLHESLSEIRQAVGDEYAHLREHYGQPVRIPAGALARMRAVSAASRPLRRSSILRSR